jgi:hypothetical protein
MRNISVGKEIGLSLGVMTLFCVEKVMRGTGILFSILASQAFRAERSLKSTVDSMTDDDDAGWER